MSKGFLDTSYKYVIIWWVLPKIDVLFYFYISTTFLSEQILLPMKKSWLWKLPNLEPLIW